MEHANTSLMTFLPLLMFLPLLLIGLGFLAFWIWVLVDCTTKEPSQGNENIVWILIIVFTSWIGALIYFFVRRPQRKKEFGA